MKKDVYLNFSRMFWSALLLMLAAIFISLAIHQASLGEWTKCMLCIVAPLPFFILALIVRRREFTTACYWKGWPLIFEMQFNYAGMWFGIFQWIFIGLHKRNEIIFKSKVVRGTEYTSSGIYEETTKRTVYNTWKGGNAYYRIKGRLLHINATLLRR